MDCRPGYVDTDESEFNDFERSSGEAGRPVSFGDKPLLVISRDPEVRQDMSPQALAQLPMWQQEQEESKSLSPRNWRVIARGSTHSVPHDRPDLIVAEMGRLIDYLHGGPAPPFGSTIEK
jgi:hypothetical protein